MQSKQRGSSISLGDKGCLFFPAGSPACQRIILTSGCDNSTDTKHLGNAVPCQALLSDLTGVYGSTSHVSPGRRSSSLYSAHKHKGTAVYVTHGDRTSEDRSWDPNPGSPLWGLLFFFSLFF